jgi:outer membrane protein assembly factor BamB
MQVSPGAIRACSREGRASSAPRDQLNGRGAFGQRLVRLTAIPALAAALLADPTASAAEAGDAPPSALSDREPPRATAEESLWSRPGEDWPAFLGPGGNGRSSLDGLRLPWPPSGPPIRWHCEMGEGYCSPSVAEGRLLAFDRVGPRMRLRCLHAETGESLWETGYESSYRDTFGYDGGPRSCPVIAAGRVVTIGPEGRLDCRSLRDGTLFWTIDTSKAYGVVQNFFGVGAAPVVERDLVILQVGGSPLDSLPPSPERLDLVQGLDSGLVAFDLATGRERWRSSDELASYATPLVVEIDGARRLLAWTRGSLLVADPVTGRVDRRHPYRADELFSVNAASPVVVGDEVLLSETYGPGSVLLDLSAAGIRVARRDGSRRQTEALRAHWATPVAADGVAYGFSGRNAGDTHLVCADWKTGDILWHEPGLGRGGLVLVDGHLLVLGEFGDLLLAEASREAFRERARCRLLDPRGGFELLDPPCWAAPVVAHGYAYVRGRGRLVCVDLLGAP